MKRIYVTEEAYEALVRYCLAKNRTLRGLSKVASELLLDAIKRAEQVSDAFFPPHPSSENA